MDCPAEHHNLYLEPTSFELRKNETTNNPTKFGPEDPVALRIIPDRGTKAFGNLKYAAHARTDVSLNHTIVSGHNMDNDMKP